MLVSFSLFAQRSDYDSLLQLQGSLKGEARAHNLILLSKRSIDVDSAFLFANQALELLTQDTTRVLALNQYAWLLKSNKEIDSAKRVLKEAQNLAAHIGFEMGMSDVYLTMGSVHQNTSAFDSALFYQNLAMEILQKHDDKDGVASILNNMSIIYQQTGEYEKSKNALFASRKIRAEQNQKKELGDIFLNLGNVYYYQGNLDSCIYAFISALEIYEQAELPNYQSYALANLAYIYDAELKKPEKAKLYFLKMLKIENELNSKNLIMNAYEGLGLYYLNQQILDSASFYFDKTLDLARSFQNKQMESHALSNLGTIQMSLGNPLRAKKLFENSLAIKRAIDDKTGMLSTLNSCAQVENELGNFEQSLQYLNEAHQLAIDLDNKFQLKSILETKIDLSKQMSNFEETVGLYEDYVALNDSLLTSERLATIEELETKYETEKQQQQITLQASLLSKHQTQNQLKTVIIFGLVIALSLLVVIFLLNRSRTRKQQAFLLQEAQTQLREAEIAAAISSQEKERSRFAKDLHDGFGQMISVLNLNLKALEQGDKDNHEVFENSSKILEEMYQELKGICFNLMPQTLIKHGITSAINELASRINQANQIQVETDFFGLDERLSDVLEISIYRISQEWINNVIKYSDASRITIQLTRDENEITLLIEDNGMGFDIEQLKSGQGNGWKNMNTRTNLINGDLELDTTPGLKGNTLIVNSKVMFQKTEVSAL